MAPPLRVYLPREALAVLRPSDTLSSRMASVCVRYQELIAWHLEQLRASTDPAALQALEDAAQAGEAAEAVARRWAQSAGLSPGAELALAEHLERATR